MRTMGTEGKEVEAGVLTETWMTREAMEGIAVVEGPWVEMTTMIEMYSIAQTEVMAEGLLLNANMKKNCREVGINFSLVAHLLQTHLQVSF